MYKFLWLAGVILLAPMGLVGCETGADAPPPTAQTAPETAMTGQGTLTLIADAEDRMREGFVSKDGWQLNFNHAYVTFNNIRAYQTDTPFDPDQGTEPSATSTLEILTSPQTVDLVGSAEDTPTVTVTQAPAGHYNALYWEIISATDGPAQGSTLLLQGTAEKEGRTIDFTIGLDKPVGHYCGEFIGDERKGFLEAGGATELETTFHFDHFFGRADRPIDQSPNDQAIGFEPFANLAEGNTLNITSQQLQSRLSAEDYNTLVYSVTELGHVGEGHCRIEQL